MPLPPSCASPSRPARRLALLLAAAVAILAAGCSRHDEDDGSEETTAEDSGAAVPGAPDASRLVDAADAAPGRDARTDEERAALTDAGRLCGEKDLPDCPLQLWMKRNATTMIQFGETTALAEVFDQIAAFAPPRHGLARVTYPNWVSIANDGAAASRVGDIPAAKAACRGCHAQYRASYHADLRALPVPVVPSTLLLLPTLVLPPTPHP